MYTNNGIKPRFTGVLDSPMSFMFSGSAYCGNINIDSSEPYKCHNLMPIWK
uniref:Uncharacterized protein n=1 Tax=Anguilla anguilla TaxID=7936 RepID=A0A0E9X294_ANGAN